MPLSKCLMKWHEPKNIARPISTKDIIISFCAIVFLSIVLGFIGGKYRISNSLFTLIFLLPYPVAFAICPFLPGSLIRLQDDAIVRTSRVPIRSVRSRYEQIDTIHYERNCSRPLDDMTYYKDIGQLRFTNFKIRMKGGFIVDDAIASARFSTVGGFSVPQNVDIEKILQILREKGVRLIESKSTRT